MKFDYIIIGAGSAGCVLANRLSVNPNTRVLLLEAGGRDWNPLIHMPVGLAKLAMLDSVNWGYYTQPQANLCGRRLYWPRGKVLGGSSSINAMCYIRGQAADYDAWAKAGNPGWSFSQLLPYFKKAEDRAKGEDEWHGISGPLAVQDLAHHNPLSEVLIEAAEAAGHPRCDDFNAGEQHGFGFYQVTQKRNRRCSSATGYLRTARGRANLVIRTGALSERIRFDGSRAVGVEYRRRGKLHTVFATQEVLLCGGAINSPQLLLLSGIGPGQQLLRHGITRVAELDGVGGNLQDHLDICILDRATSNITYDRTNDVLIGLKYWLFRRGIGTSNVAECGGFSCSRLAKNHRPDLQFHFVPAQLDDHGRNRLPGAGYTLHVCNLQPLSRGSIVLRNADPRQAPLIQPNYLDHKRDIEVMLDGVAQGREILAAEPFSVHRKFELLPGSDCNTEQAISAYIRRKAETIYHPVGTCRMGKGNLAVVDHELRVHGVEGLRVVDASIMPRLISGNTNAPTIAIAEKAAAMILEEANLSAATDLDDAERQSA